MTIVSFRPRRLVYDYRRKRPKKRVGMRTKSYIPKRIVMVYKGKSTIFKMRTPRIRLFSWKAPDPLQYMRSFNLINIPKYKRFAKKEIASQFQGLSPGNPVDFSGQFVPPHSCRMQEAGLIERREDERKNTPTV